MVKPSSLLSREAAQAVLLLLEAAQAARPTPEAAQAAKWLDSMDVAVLLTTNQQRSDEQISVRLSLNSTAS